MKSDCCNAPIIIVPVVLGENIEHEMYCAECENKCEVRKEKEDV